VETAGIGGSVEGHESVISMTFVDMGNNRFSVKDIPVYIVAGVHEVVIGRKKIFDVFRIIFEQDNDKIIL